MAPSHERLIDKLPAVDPRPVDMQVLVLSMSRTGTMSTQTALQKLGYKSYHMAETGKNPGSINCWLEGLKAKYRGEGKPYGKQELDKLLGNYSAVTDAPCIMFTDELLAAYPGAKVVLTQRDEESWLRSVDRTFFEIFSWSSFYWIAPLDPKGMGPFWETLNLITSIWTGGDFNDRQRLLQSYRDHYAHVRSKVPKDRLLEFDLDEGYEPLCRFLDRPVPAEPFPNINQPDNIIRLFTIFFWRTVARVLRRVGILAGAVGAVGLGVWWSRG